MDLNRTKCMHRSHEPDRTPHIIYKEKGPKYFKRADIFDDFVHRSWEELYRQFKFTKTTTTALTNASLESHSIFFNNKVILS